MVRVTVQWHTGLHPVMLTTAVCQQWLDASSERLGRQFYREGHGLKINMKWYGIFSEVNKRCEAEYLWRGEAERAQITEASTHRLDMLIAYLIWAGHCAKHWGHSAVRETCPPSSWSLASDRQNVFEQVIRCQMWWVSPKGKCEEHELTAKGWRRTNSKRTPAWGVWEFLDEKFTFKQRLGEWVS